MSRALASVLALVFAMAAGCVEGRPAPAALEAGESCSFCRMGVSDQRLAAQLVARGQEPRFFDDVGCLRGFLADAKAPVAGVAYVADHRTGRWIEARAALYTRAERVPTPMGSHLLAHADAGSREADTDARGGTGLTVGELFGPDGPPGGER